MAPMADDVAQIDGKRGYSWAPFTEGNTLTLRHGAWSPRTVDPLVAQLVDDTLDLAGHPGSSTAYLSEPSYRPALNAWAIAEVRAGLFASVLAEHDNGECPGCDTCKAWDDGLHRWSTSAANHRQRLGLDPLSRARLGRDVAAATLDVAALMAKLEAASTDGDDQ